MRMRTSTPHHHTTRKRKQYIDTTPHHTTPRDQNANKKQTNRRIRFVSADDWQDEYTSGGLKKSSSTGSRSSRAASLGGTLCACMFTCACVCACVYIYHLLHKPHMHTTHTATPPRQQPPNKPQPQSPIKEGQEVNYV